MAHPETVILALSFRDIIYSELERLVALDPKKNSTEGKQLEYLSSLIERFEKATL